MESVNKRNASSGIDAEGVGNKSVLLKAQLGPHEGKEVWDNRHISGSGHCPELSQVKSITLIVQDLLAQNTNEFEMDIVSEPYKNFEGTLWVKIGLVE